VTRHRPTKKDVILAVAREIGAAKYTPAEFEQIRRQLVVHLGPSAANTTTDHIASVLADAGLRVVRSTRADTEGRYEEEFHDLLHFSTFEEAEMCLVRLDELWRKFQSEDERAAAERVLEVARLGRRRAEMISRNSRVDARKRAEKSEMVEWFRIWLETPDTFFDWLDVRKQSPDFRARFGAALAQAQDDDEE
jgi:hypothetical protein